MYNNKNNSADHHKLFSSMTSPRISFSNDFIDLSQQQHHQHIMKNDTTSYYRDAPVSSDFEFSVANHSMITGADELFSKGRLLPFKEKKTTTTTTTTSTSTTTLRDELLNNDEDDFTLRIPKSSSSSTRWKGLLGLKKSHIGSKKNEEKRSDELVHNNSREAYNGSGTGSSCRDMEFRFN
ncbi:PREDICTED: uncharacterized protein LOC109209328 [Nicotiana attenuata]|uniref:Uncharacterized protein n=1 Tax=Nicotiana attenuata TaxID=49451 RepID=A0A314KNY3_NICAT|nr:PREDICTED: uncharacterized protein LOC109209328 [Nicotiana attenuata]XP_019228134.1 PREDICTED: uncharacterized protein LOC109209328 [Nicotiana attenuata]XP_019228135.1 PREDICTED: uncharacterized protein LOC109209328 [Nicotiana attenuata]OIT30952.1 hypothetical protein A4A49_28818 [Nicotiana attenuata]